MMGGYRMVFLGGVAAGYVLGTRAGRERYDQIMDMTHRVTDNPRAQQATGSVQAQATKIAKSAQQRFSDARLQERIPGAAGAAKNKAADGMGMARSKASGTMGAAREHIPGLRHRNGHSDEDDGNGNISYPYPTTAGAGAGRPGPIPDSGRPGPIPDY